MVNKVKNFLKNIVTGFIPFWVRVFKESFFFMRFLIILCFVFPKYILNIKPKKTLEKVRKKPLFSLDFVRNFYDGIYSRVLKVFDVREVGSVKYSDLILMAMRHLQAKRNRTFVTIGGMSVGFGAVILLLSVGYGFEKLVISQVASLAEIKQVEVNISQNSPLRFDSSAISSVSSIEGVDFVSPIVMSVAKVNYNNAVSDVVVYGVNSQYLFESQLSALKGSLFEDEKVNFEKEDTEEKEGAGEVAGVVTLLIGGDSFEKEVYKVRYSINPVVWKPVYAKPDSKSGMLGYTKRVVGRQDAVEVWGASYPDSPGNKAVDVVGQEYSVWVKAELPLWSKEDCLVAEPDCVEGNYRVMKDTGSQSVRTGYITQEDLVVERYEFTKGSALEIYKGKIIDKVNFQLKEGETHMFFDADDTAVSVFVEDYGLGQGYTGQVTYGGYYENSNGYYVTDKDGLNYGYWVKSTIQLWKPPSCSDVCRTYYTGKGEKGGSMVSLEIYFKASELIFPDALDGLILGDVLGAQTKSPLVWEEGEVLGSQNVLGTDAFIEIESLLGTDDTFDWSSISSELGIRGDLEKDVKEFGKDAKRIALVNIAMLNLLSIDENSAVGEEFDATIVFDSKLFNKSNYIVESEQASFEIIGVVSDNKNPTFYIPLSTIAVEGMYNASSLKVVLKDPDVIADVRAEIESLGFQTNSVVDTIEGISSLFSSLRIGLLILGLIALGVGSLGMFNTLTVSLLEQTREIGLLKIMGMKSGETKVLFLTESIIMSIMGGLAGLLLGFILGKTLSIIISIIAISQGYEFIEVTHIPFLLAAGLMGLSAVVGVATGWYPAERAKKISALNALRYE